MFFKKNTERQSLLLVKVKLTILLKKVHFRGVLWPKTCSRDMLTLGEIFFDLPFNPNFIETYSGPPPPPMEKYGTFFTLLFHWRRRRPEISESCSVTPRVPTSLPMQQNTS